MNGKISFHLVPAQGDIFWAQLAEVKVGEFDCSVIDDRRHLSLSRLIRLHFLWVDHTIP